MVGAAGEVATLRSQLLSTTVVNVTNRHYCGEIVME